MKRVAEESALPAKKLITPIERALKRIVPIKNNPLEARINYQDEVSCIFPLDLVLPWIDFWKYETLIAVSHTFRYKMLHVSLYKTVIRNAKENLNFQTRSDLTKIDTFLHYVYELFCSDLISSVQFFKVLTKHTQKFTQRGNEFKFFISTIPGAPSNGIWQDDAFDFERSHKDEHNPYFAFPVLPGGNTMVDYACAHLAISGVSPTIPEMGTHFERFNKNDRHRIYEAIFQKFYYENLPLQLGCCSIPLEDIEHISNLQLQNGSTQKRMSFQCKCTHPFPSMERLQLLEERFSRDALLTIIRFRFVNRLWITDSLTDDHVIYLLDNGYKIDELTAYKLEFTTETLQKFGYHNYITHSDFCEFSKYHKTTLASIGKFECFQTIESIDKWLMNPNKQYMWFLIRHTKMRVLLRYEPKQGQRLRDNWQLFWPRSYRDWTNGNYSSSESEYESFDEESSGDIDEDISDDSDEENSEEDSSDDSEEEEGESSDDSNENSFDSSDS